MGKALYKMESNGLFLCGLENSKWISTYNYKYISFLQLPSIILIRGLGKSKVFCFTFFNLEVFKWKRHKFRVNGVVDLEFASAFTWIILFF